MKKDCRHNNFNQVKFVLSNLFSTTFTSFIAERNKYYIIPYINRKAVASGQIDIHLN